MQSFFEDIVGRLVQHQVEFVVVGGMSGVLQGAPITTRDLDLCYRRSPENIRRLVTALQPLSPRPRGFPPELPFFFDERTIQLGSNFTLVVGLEDLDLLGDMGGLGGYEDVIDAVDEMEVAGFRLYVLSLEQLITTKRSAGRAKDLAVLPTLEATLAVQRRTVSGHD